MWDSLCEVREDEKAIFGNLWQGGDKFRHWEETLIVKLPKATPDGNGQEVEIYCTAAPARFYTVKALPTPNSCNQMSNGYEISTSSGDNMARLALELAQWISQGMIGVKETVAKTNLGVTNTADI